VSVQLRPPRLAVGSKQLAVLLFLRALPTADCVLITEPVPWPSGSGRLRDKEKIGGSIPPGIIGQRSEIGGQGPERLLCCPLTSDFRPLKRKGYPIGDGARLERE
jgi:hypothetical protein